MGVQILVYLIAQRQYGFPFFVAEWFGYPWVFQNSGDFVGEIEFYFALVGAATDGGGRHRVRGAGEGNMTFAGKQAGCWVEPHPAGTGQKYFTPGMQIREVMVGARWAIQRFLVGGQLYQIAGGKAGGQPQMA